VDGVVGESEHEGESANEKSDDADENGSADLELADIVRCELH
jgi:hypothetical protein